VLFEDASRGPDGLSGKDRAKFMEMQEALEKEFQYRLRKSSGGTDDVMDDKDVAEFLMENYGRPALLK